MSEAETENKLTVIDEGKSISPIADPHNDYALMISQAVTNPAVDADKLHKLLDFKERLDSTEAEKAFNRDFLAAKMEMPMITKTGSVEYPVDKNKPDGAKKEAFKFAKYEDLDKAIRPIEKKFGFSRVFTTEERAQSGGGVIVTCELLHAGGHFKKASIPVALDTSGGKNNIQAMGSSFSYGKRYTTTMLWDIVTEGEDNDGNGAPIGPELLKIIEDMIEEIGADKRRFCEFMKVESLAHILQKDYAKALNNLNAKKNAVKKKNDPQTEKTS